MLAISIVTSLHAQNVQTPFDVDEVIEQVSRNTSRPTSAGEFLIDTNVVYVPSCGEQLGPSVAFDGTNYLVVWTDSRAGITYPLECWDIYAARVTDSGRLLDEAGVLVASAFGLIFYTQSVSVAFDGTNYLVTWETFCASSGWDISCARMSRQGIVLDPVPITVSGAPNNQRNAAVAFDGTNYLVTWKDHRYGSDDIFAARVTRSGVVLDSNGFIVSTASGDQWYPAVVFGETQYMVTWADGRNGNFDVYGARITPTAIVLDTSGIGVSVNTGRQGYPSLAFDGVEYLVVWEDSRSGSVSDIYGSRVSQSGSVLDPAGIPISQGSFEKAYPAVAFDGRNYVVTWSDRRGGNSDIYGARVSATGAVLDPNGIPVSTAFYSQWSPAIAADDSNSFVAWSDCRSYCTNDIFAARLSKDGRVIDTTGLLVSASCISQNRPATAFDGNNYLCVWQDYRNSIASGIDIYASRVTQAGMILDPIGRVISNAMDDQVRPAVAFNGTNFLVVWKDYRQGIGESDIYGARVTRDGVVLDPGGVAVSTALDDQANPSVATDGTSYLAVWDDLRSASVGDIYGARVSGTGLVLDPSGIPIARNADGEWSPGIAFDGSNYLVAWQSDRPNIYCKRVAPAGTVIDTISIPLASWCNMPSRPEIAFDGTNYLIVWDDYRNTYDINICGTRVSKSGSVLDPSGIRVCVAPGIQVFPTVQYDGLHYVVLWEDTRDSMYSDIHGAWLNSAGAVIDYFLLTVQPGCQFGPTMAHGSGTQVLAIYSGWTDSIGHRPANTMRIWGKFLPPVGIEEQADARYTIHDARLKITPNPFRWEAKIELGTGHGAKRMALRIYDVSGRMVRSFPLSTRYTLLATSTIAWDGSDDSAGKLPAGVYFCRLENGETTVTQKMMKLK